VPLKKQRELKTLKQFKEEVDNLAHSILSGKDKKTIRVLIQEAITHAEWGNIEKFEARRIIDAAFGDRGVSAGYIRKCLQPEYKHVHQARTKKRSSVQDRLTDQTRIIHELQTKIQQMGHKIEILSQSFVCRGSLFLGRDNYPVKVIVNPNTKLIEKAEIDLEKISHMAREESKRQYESTRKLL
jgi:hypothetical protein